MDEYSYLQHVALGDHAGLSESTSVGGSMQKVGRRGARVHSY